MPPPAPRTATFVCRAEEEEKARVWVDKRRAAERVNMAVKMVATSSQSLAKTRNVRANVGDSTGTRFSERPCSRRRAPDVVLLF